MIGKWLERFGLPSKPLGANRVIIEQLPNFCFADYFVQFAESVRKCSRRPGRGLDAARS